MTGRGISRRTFLASAAALPLFATRGSKPRVAVIGAGAFGGWTAYHLRNLGADVTLIDEWGPGNPLSSSGGKTRVIRAIYGADRIYVEMVKRSYELWEKIAPTSKEPLYVPTGVLWMMEGDDAYVRSALPILHDFGFAVDQLTVAAAAKKYPQIDFKNVKTVYFEHRGGALFASRACHVVAAAVEKAGGKYRQAAAKPGPIVNGSMKHVVLGDGSRIEADAYVFACGPWLGKVFPEVIDGRVKPTRQEVYYFAIPNDRYVVGHLPIWVNFAQHIIYGIPGVDGRYFKMADDTRGEIIDPTTQDRHPRKEGIEQARAFLAQRFPEIAKQQLLSAEVCQYENSPDGNLIIDKHPNAKNVWIAGGGSGHGFKLSPAVGEIMANAIVSGKDIPKTFRLARLHDLAKPKTQFQDRQ